MNLIFEHFCAAKLLKMKRYIRDLPEIAAGVQLDEADRGLIGDDEMVFNYKHLATSLTLIYRLLEFIGKISKNIFLMLKYFMQ